MARYRTTFVVKTKRPLTDEERQDHARDIRGLIEVNMGFGEAGIIRASKPKLARLRKGDNGKSDPLKALIEARIEELTDKIAALKPENFDGQDSLDRRTDRRNHGYARRVLQDILIERGEIA